MTHAHLSSVTPEAARRRRAVVKPLPKLADRPFAARSLLRSQHPQSHGTDHYRFMRSRGVLSSNTRGPAETRRHDSIPISRAGPSV
jgi:hypothetical protein